MYCHFPHGGQPDSVTERIPGCRPSTYVHRGDWKLIRFYCDNADQTDHFELYNLRDDAGERHDLAAKMPEKVRELNALIDRFLADTQAVIPAKNPNYVRDAKRPPVKKHSGQVKLDRQPAAADWRLQLEAANEP